MSYPGTVGISLLQQEVAGRVGHGSTEHRKQLLEVTLLLAGGTAWILSQLGVLGPNFQLANFEEIK